MASNWTSRGKVGSPKGVDKMNKQDLYLTNEQIEKRAGKGRKNESKRYCYNAVAKFAVDNCIKKLIELSKERGHGYITTYRLEELIK